MGARPSAGSCTDVLLVYKVHSNSLHLSGHQSSAFMLCRRFLSLVDGSTVVPQPARTCFLQPHPCPSHRYVLAWGVRQRLAWGVGRLGPVASLYAAPVLASTRVWP